MHKNFSGKSFVTWIQSQFSLSFISIHQRVGLNEWKLVYTWHVLFSVSSHSSLSSHLNRLSIYVSSVRVGKGSSATRPCNSSSGKHFQIFYSEWDTKHNPTHFPFKIRSGLSFLWSNSSRKYFHRLHRLF